MKAKPDHELFDKILKVLTLRAAEASMLDGGPGDGAWVRGFVSGIHDAFRRVDGMRGHRGADDGLAEAREAVVRALRGDGE
jgi:hypothetical protein